MGLYFDKLSPAHKIAVMDIFNYYIKRDTSAFPQNPLNDDFFEILLERAKNLPAYAVTLDNRTIGFCTLNPFNPFSTFDNVATITIFLNPKFTQMGIGSMCLKKLENDAISLGIETLIAEISSLNEISINFHIKHGYVFAGNLKNIGKKLGTTFGIVYMQKFL